MGNLRKTGQSFWATRAALSLFASSSLLFSSHCGLNIRTSYLMNPSKIQCTNTIPTGACSGSPFTRVQVVPATCPQGSACHIIQNQNNLSQSINETTGNLLVAFAYGGQNPASSPGGTAPNMKFSVSDTLGNTYYPGPFINNHLYDDSAVQIFYAMNIKGGPNTVTVVSSAPQAENFYTGLMLAEYSGVATELAADIASGQPAPSALNNASPGAMTIRSACDLVVGGQANGHQGPEAETAGAGWVEPLLDQWDPAAFVDDVATGGASQGASVNATIHLPIGPDDGWAAAQMAFRAAGSATPCPPVQMNFLTAPQSVTHGTCSGIVTVQSEDSSGVALSSATGIAFTLSGSGVTYYADPACGFPITDGFIGAGMTSASFYYKAASAGAVNVTVTPSGFTPMSQAETSL